MAKYNALQLFIISDSVGETAQKVINSVIVQFPELEEVDTRRFSFIDTEDDLLNILRDALTEQAVVVSTLVNKHLNDVAENFANHTGLKYIDYMSPLMNLIEDQTGCPPQRKARAQYALDKDYFTKMEAVEFAVKYDDGKDPKGFLKADFVLLGVSRSSKTPLSIYLANKIYKVANLPLIPSIPLPKELYDVPPKKIIGLLANPESILSSRKSRLTGLGLQDNSSYTDIERIQEEIDYAKKVYQELGALTVNIDDMAIEEIAEYIISRKED